ncbi:LysR family transcriptional regulator, partial [Salmonella sp. sc-h42]|nr:LysR family transcriptional regulator [Salmonella sp. sc-h42]
MRALARAAAVEPSSSLQWDDVRYFLVLAREGSLSAAARRLAVEHTTVARRADA